MKKTIVTAVATAALLAACSPSHDADNAAATNDTVLLGDESASIEQDAVGGNVDAVDGNVGDVALANEADPLANGGDPLANTR